MILQKRNKIIILTFLIITLIVVWQASRYIRNHKNSSSSQTSTKNKKIRILNNGCVIGKDNIMKVCRYSPLGESVTITQTAKIQRNNRDIIIPAVRQGNLDVFKVNLLPLLSNTEYQDIASKIGNTFTLCFTFNPPLSHLQAFSDSTNFVSDQVVCTGKLTRNSNLNFSFIGTIPIIQATQQAMHIDIWSVPDSVKDIHSWNEFNNNLASFTPIIRITPAVVIH